MMYLQAKLIGGLRDGGTIRLRCATYDEMAWIRDIDIPTDKECAEYDHYELRGGIKGHREYPHFRCEMYFVDRRELTGGGK